MPMRILNLQRRLHELGRIRIGQRIEGRRQDGSTFVRPAKLSEFRFTSPSEQAIRNVAGLYGGTPERWEDAPVGEQWEVITEAHEFPILAPPADMALSQAFELWSGGGCVRRCDGEHTADGGDCVCAALDEAEDRETERCKPHTRVSLILGDMPTSGLWRLETSGWYAANELAGAFDFAQMLMDASGKRILPGTLRLEARTVKRPDEPPKNFNVPVLDFAVDPTLFGGRAVPVLDTPGESFAPGPVRAIPAQEQKSLAAATSEVNNPQPRPRRANAAEPRPPSGRGPRSAADRRKASAEAGAGSRGPRVAALFERFNGLDRDQQRGFLEGTRRGHFPRLSDVLETQTEELEGLEALLDLITSGGGGDAPAEAVEPEPPAAEEPPSPTPEPEAPAPAAPVVPDEVTYAPGEEPF